jgi:tRNA pseudouridine55 synthase
MIPLDAALAFLPAVELAGDEARRAAHGVAVPGRAEGFVRLRDEQGLIALAEPRSGSTLKPVVGFRG